MLRFFRTFGEERPKSAERKRTPYTAAKAVIWRPHKAPEITNSLVDPHGIQKYHQMRGRTNFKLKMTFTDPYPRSAFPVWTPMPTMSRGMTVSGTICSRDSSMSMGSPAAAGVAAAKTKSHRGVMAAVPKELSLGLTRRTVNGLPPYYVLISQRGTDGDKVLYKVTLTVWTLVAIPSFFKSQIP